MPYPVSFCPAGDVKTLTILVRGGSASSANCYTCDDREHTWAFLVINRLNKAFNDLCNSGGVKWRVLNMAKSGTDSQYSFMDYRTYDEEREEVMRSDEVHLVMWEYALNDDHCHQHCSDTGVWDAWVTRHLTTYPQATLGFLFTQGYDLLAPTQDGMVKSLSNFPQDNQNMFAVSQGTYALLTNMTWDQRYDRINGKGAYYVVSR